MSFTNLYYKRVAGTARPCYICCKPTSTVLATLNTTDFLYTCPTHLTDRGFATPLGEAGDGAQGTRKLGLSPEEVAKVKEEWEERQKGKSDNESEKDKEKEKEKEGNKKEEDKDKGKGKEEKRSESVQDKAANKTATSSGASSPATPSHERYTLHRDYFAMRLAEHRKRRQAAQAKELGPRLPSAPNSMPT